MAQIELKKVSDATVQWRLKNWYCTFAQDCTANNGNIMMQEVYPPQPPGVAGALDLTMNYDYDAVNRLLPAQEPKAAGTAAAQSFGYDQYGNRWMTGMSVEGGSAEIPPGTPNGPSWFNTRNRATNPSVDHDMAGNLTRSGAHQIRWDVEGRKVEDAIPPGSTTYQTWYAYDAAGRRVRRQVSNEAWTVYVYDAGVRVVVEYESAGGPVTETNFLDGDHLGSTRMVADAAELVRKRYGYLPFGEELRAGVNGRTALEYGGTGGVAQRFTGKERDAETGLDYSLYRYSSSAQGRWTSPDPLPGWPSDPQSWNRYAYVRNNPLLYRDPLGLSYEVCDTQGNCTKNDLSDRDFNKFKKDSTGDFFSNGKIYHRNDDGSTTQTGTYRRTGDDLDDRSVSILMGLERRADASNKMIAAFAVGSAAVGVAGGGFVAATELSGGSGLTTIMTGGEAIGVEGLGAEEVALVSRWGRPGLQPGDWVMNGGRTASNYLRSFKWEPSNVFTRVGNQFTKFTQGETYLVPKSAVQNPSGWEAFKQAFGQRIFKP